MSDRKRLMFFGSAPRPGCWTARTCSSWATCAGPTCRRSPQGGSELSLSITGGADGRWTVERRYKEPGADAQVVTYTAERRGAALISTDGSLTGYRGGGLVLELNSGNDSLPPDYWVHDLKAE